MTQLIYNKLAESGSVVLQVTADDLREVVKTMYAEERERVEKGIKARKEKPTLSRNEVAKMLGVTYTTLWSWAKSGYLVPVKIGTKVMYKASDVDALLTKYSQSK